MTRSHFVIYITLFTLHFSSIILLSALLPLYVTVFLRTYNHRVHLTQISPLLSRSAQRLHKFRQQYARCNTIIADPLLASIGAFELSLALRRDSSV